MSNTHKIWVLIINNFIVIGVTVFNLLTVGEVPVYDCLCLVYRFQGQKPREPMLNGGRIPTRFADSVSTIVQRVTSQRWTKQSQCKLKPAPGTAIERIPLGGRECIPRSLATFPKGREGAGFTQLSISTAALSNLKRTRPKSDNIWVGQHTEIKI